MQGNLKMNEESMREILEQLVNLVTPPEIEGRVAIDSNGSIYIESITTNNNHIALKVEAQQDCYHVTFEGGFRGDERFETNLEPIIIHDVVEAAVELSALVCQYVDEDIEVLKDCIRDKWMDPSDAMAIVTERQIEHSANME